MKFKQWFGIALLINLFACGQSAVLVSYDDKKVKDLEDRMTLNEQLDLVQNNLFTVQNLRLDLLESRLDALEGSLASNLEAQALVVQALENQLTEVQDALETVQNSVYNTQQSINNIYSNLDSLELIIDQLTNDSSSLVSRMLAAENNITFLLNKVVTIVDPCPTINNSEMLLKVENKLVAFYQKSQGGFVTHGFLSVLVPNTQYQTTDGGPSCVFTVNESGNGII